MNLKAFLKQTVRYRPPAGANEWGDESYGPVVTLPARAEERQRRVATPGGVEMLADTVVMVEPEIKVGGQINAVDAIEENYRTIQARENIVDVGGRILGWKAFL